MKKSANIRPVGHVTVTSAAIGSLSILLAAGLELLGISARLNVSLLELLSRGGESAGLKALPDWSGWLASIFLGYGLPLAMLSVPGMWRRWVLWISTLFFMICWAPVMILAAHAPVVSTPVIVVLWAGICGLIYANHHQMPCESGGNHPKK